MPSPLSTLSAAGRMSPVAEGYMCAFTPKKYRVPLLS
jgi:hypothetical protein